MRYTFEATGSAANNLGGVQYFRSARIRDSVDEAVTDAAEWLRVCAINGSFAVSVRIVEVEGE